MKRALVTGAGGFVGANLARRLIRSGHETHLLLSPGTDCWRLQDVLSQARHHAVDLTDGAAVRAAVERIRPEWVFHLAAYGAYSWQTDLPRMIATNLGGTINLVQACLRTGFESMVNTGSSSEYGFKDHAPSEREMVEPNSHYAITKVAATHFCRHTAVTRGMPLRTLRLYSVFGPWEEPNRFIPTLIVRGLRGDLPPLVHPETARDYVYVDDVVDAYLLAAQHQGSDLGAIFNVGTAIQTSVRQVVDLVRRIMNVAAEPAWGSMPDRTWDSHVWVSDPRKIRDELGWSPRHSFEDGFRASVEWLRSQPGIEQYYLESMGRHER